MSNNQDDGGNDNSELSTKVTRFLEQQQVDYRLLWHRSAAVTIAEAARQRGIEPGQMVKSILLRDMSDRYALACAPGDCSVDPKKVRALLGWRRMTCVDLEHVYTITGYQLGTVTPLLLATPMPVVFDHRLEQYSTVTISSGSDMAGIALRYQDLIALCQPCFGDICRQ
ncbi:aminoacyl-tRNA deacylase [Vibrio sp.]|uniref:aminoacyl-tRNA deacylase n=1 Tax=Vibrio sp. TaxID=678 RepID=UPI003D1087F4